MTAIEPLTLVAEPYRFSVLRWLIDPTISIEDKIGGLMVAHHKGATMLEINTLVHAAGFQGLVPFFDAWRKVMRQEPYARLTARLEAQSKERNLFQGGVEQAHRDAYQSAAIIVRVARVNELDLPPWAEHEARTAQHQLETFLKRPLTPDETIA